MKESPMLHHPPPSPRYHIKTVGVGVGVSKTLEGEAEGGLWGFGDGRAKVG